MCGRFTITLAPAEFEEEFDLENIPEDYNPRYNVAPSQSIWVVRDPTQRKVEKMRWGLVPFWAKDLSIGSRMINARAETLEVKPAFRTAFQKRRCLILADGFYEWDKGPSGKGSSIPHYFYLKEHKPFMFAGLWESWGPAPMEPVLSCAIITCQPNELLAEYHDRMPVILDKATAWEWVRDGQNSAQLSSLLRPYPAEAMDEHQVSTMVNSPALNVPEMIRLCVDNPE
jgi:putative SOS response-associated peptidase YedK